MTKKEVSIRLAKSEDAKNILELLKVLNAESNTIEIATNIKNMDIKETKEQIELVQNTTSNLILVATFGDDLIGIGTAIEKSDHSNSSELGVAVLQKFQKNGIGTALVDELIYWGESFSSIESLFLTVKKDNKPAIKIYESLGFIDSKNIENDIRTMIYEFAPLVG